MLEKVFPLLISAEILYYILCIPIKIHSKHLQRKYL